MTVRKRSATTALELLSMVLLGTGCSSGVIASETEKFSPPPAQNAAVCEEGALRCRENAVQRCDGGKWIEQEPCAVSTVCSGETCAPGPERSTKRLRQIRQAIENAKKTISNPEAVDVPSIEALAWKELALGDDDDHYASALRVAFQSLKQGHQSLTFSDCFWQNSNMGYAGYTRYGVCLRAYGDHMVVSSATASNPLGLRAGDEILGVKKEGESVEMDHYALRIPMCTASYPSLVSARHHAALSLTAGFEAGTLLQVRSGAVSKDIQVPPSGTKNMLDCSEPFGREGYEVSSQIRPDGVGVVHFRSLFPGDVDANATEEEFAAAEVRFVERIRSAFEKVKSAKGIVWDMRGNGGGLTLVGLKIVAGMPGARKGVFTECYHRSNTTVPATFSGPTHHYELEPGGDFAVPVGKKVAVVIDGSNYSAADYFAYFVRNATAVKLVGDTTAGAFGGGRNPQKVPDATLPATLSIDPTGCRAMNGDLLEGRGVEPHIRVELDPASLRNGVDNVLERALEEVK